MNVPTLEEANAAVDLARAKAELALVNVRSARDRRNANRCEETITALILALNASQVAHLRLGAAIIMARYVARRAANEIRRSA